MATQRQKKLAQAIVENLQSEETKTAGELLEKVGYSEHLVKQPGRVMEQEGVKEELALLGFNENRAKAVVSEILETSEDHNRLKAADMIFKVHGSYAPEKSVNLNLNATTNLSEEQIAQINEITLNDE